jgi:hypothetical protein
VGRRHGKSVLWREWGEVRRLTKSREKPHEQPRM